MWKFSSFLSNFLIKNLLLKCNFFELIKRKILYFYINEIKFVKHLVENYRCRVLNTPYWVEKEQ